ncbi:MAG TPA: acyl-CoA thioesterase domain-containing protein [Solirubrobacteraceae bacterium]|jgi:acyl-CoA thioesterase-2|nr:acyl-CoA thioesterase domain-containing protein [Solirubrobacteraceae bacterium]
MIDRADAEEPIDEAFTAFGVRQEGAQLVGESPLWFGPHVFGGILLAQALDAAGRTVPDQGRARSLHAYFLRAADATAPLRYEVVATKDGRSSHVREVTVSQNDTAVLKMLCSFAADRPGPSYELARAEDVPDPSELSRRAAAGPWEFAFVGPTPARDDGARDSTYRAWMRLTAGLPDDARAHECALAFLGDVTWNGACPWDLSSPPDRSRMVSVDHAMWFHRAARADDWLFYDVQSLVHDGGRGTIRGLLHGADRRIICSTVQELQFR